MALSITMVSYAQSDIKWDYPIKPGTEEWNQLKSIDEMYQLCQIPDNILGVLNTTDLINICLNFPAPPEFLFFYTPQECFFSFYSNFNGVRELFNREDVGLCLLERYDQMTLSDYNPQWPLYKQGQFISQYKFIETMLAQTQVQESLKSEEQKYLMKEIIEKMDEKLSKSDLFSDNNIEINMWPMAKLLSINKRLDVQGIKAEDMNWFLDSGLFVGIDVKIIYEQSVNFAYENNSK